MTLPISTWTDQGIGLDVFCECGRTGYASAEAAKAKLDNDMSLAVAAHHLICSACGAKGGALVVRFSIGDYYEIIRKRGSLVP